MEPDFHLDHRSILRAFVNFDVIKLDTKIFHLYGQVINDVQKLIVQSFDYLENMGYKHDWNSVGYNDENCYVLFV